MTKPQILRTVAQVRQWRRQALLNNKTVGLVPTMGALHRGHLSLVGQSLSENDHTIVSIFVNPSQFAPHEDLDKYPRTVDEDLAKLEGAEPVLASASAVSRQVSAVFIPKVSEMYPSGITMDVSQQKGAFVSVVGLSEQLEGVTRPQFFRGVATVVTKLLNIVTPERVYFGQKDAQQCVVVKNLVRDLLIDTEVRVMPTLREPNGLAMSSRNAYLSQHMKDESSVIYQALTRGEKYYLNKSSGDVGVASLEIIDEIRSELASKNGFKIEYIAVSDPNTLEDLSVVVPGTGAIISTALRVKNEEGNEMRLIDNVCLQ
ncbi:pantothenate synthase [Suhomyces tanzawaensis NRRL Y-17324]|uniref:Pantoate--beta-alanine ligase n=1 Tax=Suhomyces tanzawaensis NRRL Y-17324 TaxID=984487 RepID=A0A1E4SRW9_9ASCO|nr:pantothenate synthase [Suhomyces tanzawaensis NRRL Y-17324]ODV82142.1 pantothenate synthase [Suhomyces tanzawaensis NRRL Y-17324]